MNKKVSIVIPCFNSEGCIGDAIKSALDQTYSPLEVIVIDDGSTDDSLEVIQSYDKRVTWRTGKNRGACHARNRGIKLSEGELVKFLDADDILLRNNVKRQVRGLQRLEIKNAVVFGDLFSRTNRCTDISSEVIREVGLGHLVGKGITTPCTLHKVKLLKEVGGFKEGLKRGQEYDLHIRMKLEGIRFFYQPGGTLKERDDSPKGISYKTFAGRNPAPRISLFRRICDLLKEAYGKVPSTAREPLAKRWWITGRQALRGGHKQEAKTCFKISQELDEQYIVGSKSYCLLTRIMGPFWAERIGTWMKKWSGTKPNTR